MKAKQLLDWLCQASIDCKNVNMIDVPDEGYGEGEQNIEWWLDTFGGLSPYAIESGKYLYYYESVYPYSVCINGECYMPDAQVEIHDTNGFDYINLYLIED